MKLLVDGELVSVQNDLTIIYDNIILQDAEEEYEAELHVRATHEGIITDVWNYSFEPEDCVATSGETAQEIVDRLVE